jgi:hypothetical protein
VVSIAALLASSHEPAAQSPALRIDSVDATTRAALYCARDTVWRSWFANDSATLSRILPAAVAAGGPNGWEDRTIALRSAREFVTAGHGHLLAIHFDSTRVDLRGDVAMLRSRFVLIVEADGKRSTRSGIATEVFVKQGGRWVNPFWYLEP